jgi:hypothetical protein
MQSRNKKDEKISFSPKLFQSRPFPQTLKQYVKNGCLSLPVFIIGAGAISINALLPSITGGKPKYYYENGWTKATVELSGLKRILIHAKNYYPSHSDEALSKDMDQMKNAGIIILTYNINDRVYSFACIQRLTLILKEQREAFNKIAIYLIGVDPSDLINDNYADLREVDREDVINFLSKEKYLDISFYELQDGIYSEYDLNYFHQPLETFSDDHCRFAERAIDKITNDFQEQESKKNKKCCPCASYEDSRDFLYHT